MFTKFLIIFGLGLMFISCNRMKESKNAATSQTNVHEKEISPIPLEQVGQGHPQMNEEEQRNQPHPPSDAPKVKRKVTVPESVQGKWKAVKLDIKDKKDGKAENKEVSLESEFTIANSNINVQVKEFLPHMMIGENDFTSVSNDLNNPAVHLVITEQGKQLFDGWAYAKYPNMYNFQHDKYSVTLVDYIPAK